MVNEADISVKAKGTQRYKQYAPTHLYTLLEAFGFADKERSDQTRVGVSDWVYS